MSQRPDSSFIISVVHKEIFMIATFGAANYVRGAPLISILILHINSSELEHPTTLLRSPTFGSRKLNNKYHMRTRNLDSSVDDCRNTRKFRKLFVEVEIN